MGGTQSIPTPVKIPTPQIGAQGMRGVGISSTTISSTGMLTINYTDGTTNNVQVPLGPSGAAGKDAVGIPGIGVKSAVVDALGNLTITLTDNTTQGPFNIKGIKGDSIVGANGKDGVNGKDAAGYPSSQLMYFSSGTLGVSPVNINMTNGYQTLGSATQVELSNDIASQKAFVIAGNSSDTTKNGKKQVKLYDDLTIGNNLNIGGNFCDANGNCITPAAIVNAVNNFNMIYSASGLNVKGTINATSDISSGGKINSVGDHNIGGNANVAGNIIGAKGLTIVNDGVSSGGSWTAQYDINAKRNVNILDAAGVGHGNFAANASGDLLLTNNGGKQWNFGNNTGLYMPGGLITSSINMPNWTIADSGDLNIKSNNGASYFMPRNFTNGGNKWLVGTGNYGADLVSYGDALVVHNNQNNNNLQVTGGGGNGADWPNNNHGVWQSIQLNRL